MHMTWNKKIIPKMAGVAMVQTSRTVCVLGPFFSRVIRPSSGKYVQVRSMASQSPSDAVKRGVDEVKKDSNNIKEQVSSQTENIANQSKESAEKVAGVAENMADKAKQKAQDAWKAAKEAARKVKKNVPHNADEAANAIKGNMDTAKRKISKD